MSRSRLSGVVDTALEATVAGSFSRAGYAVRSKMEHWRPPGSLAGRVVVVTGASSGIGGAVADELARLHATLWLVGRDRERTEAAARRAHDLAEGATAEPVVLDIVDAGAVREFAERVASVHDHLDGLVHAAGALYPKYRSAPDGTELTVATGLLAPFRLTELLGPLLRRSADANIVTVSSGGMYTERFDLEHLVMSPASYRGTTAYARVKRAQVVLSHEWARRWGADGVASYAAHPGWVDTPGLASGLPSFAKLGPLLRTPAEGADTVAWLAAGAARREDPAYTEGFFHDRHLRGEHHLPWTARGASAADGPRLWEWCEARTGTSALA
ncbi:MAG: SDR family NAD(P)-dependent oxidoreductase [Acidimicrobiales bacterium]|jgi:NAD(P)-dependent dehydrogenase (short-subunit alcohol dehydrogenase family)